MQHQIDFQEARALAAADAAEAIASLRRQLDHRSDQYVSALRDLAALQLQAEDRLRTALGPSLRPGLGTLYALQDLERKHARLLHHTRLLYNGCLTRDADIVRLKALGLASLRHALQLESANPAAEPPYSGDPRAYGVPAAEVASLASDLLDSKPLLAIDVEATEAFLSWHFEDRGEIPPLTIPGAYTYLASPGQKDPEACISFSPRPRRSTGSVICPIRPPWPPAPADRSFWLSSLPRCRPFGYPTAYDPWNTETHSRT
jgi:hypothetical protein